VAAAGIRGRIASQQRKQHEVPGTGSRCGKRDKGCGTITGSLVRREGVHDKEDMSMDYYTCRISANHGRIRQIEILIAGVIFGVYIAYVLQGISATRSLVMHGHHGSIWRNSYHCVIFIMYKIFMA